ncbi:MAG: 2-oxoglutarate dehydrogenase E1 component [Gemmataceae bacterium]
MNQSFATRSNLGAIEHFYQRWRHDHASVDESWRAFFEGFELGLQRQAEHGTESTAQTKVVRLIAAYRELGHLQAHLDPLGEPPPAHPQLELSSFGLSNADLDATFDASAFVGLKSMRLRDLIDVLRETYCRKIGYEYMHIQDLEIRRWLRERIEPTRGRPTLAPDRKRHILRQLQYAELFEKFLATKFQGAKRFGLEGGEPLIPLLDTFVHSAPDAGVQEFVIGMAHRGRLNVLANILGKPYEQIFAEFDDHLADGEGDGDGDVKYHLGYSSTLKVKGKDVHLSLTPNPSHLEAVNPVVAGRVRAKQEFFGDATRKRGVAIIIHGDAAMPGQGQVAETLNFAGLEGYTTGGTLHVVINNQVGFTTNPIDARSTAYCTEVAKIVQAPIFHVNADDPESAVYAAEVALEFRQKFGRDVVIDLVCFRRNGHNETDEPAYTQPVMYTRIRSKPSSTAIYADQLHKQGDMTVAETAAIDAEFHAKLDATLHDMRKSPKRPRGMVRFEARWNGYSHRYSHNPVPTGVSLDVLRLVNDALTRVPPGFTPHPNIVRTVLDRQRAVIEKNEPADWAHAELLAFGSLVAEGTPVRLSGQDCRRGTFSQRHAALYDVNTGARYVPLEHVRSGQARFQVYDSPLSEYSVLGFEFGYSMDDPKSLVLWEAQFGDFANGAQVIIDQFLASSESKWQRSNGLVLLLPHGYEGQGPEHSSARPERFLQLAAEDNIQVANATTPSQYFHLLRRQMKRTFRKPLVVMTPKSLLRHPLARSALAEMASGTFREVLDDPRTDPLKVRRVVLCSGKLYYDFFFDTKAERDKQIKTPPSDVAIIRIEQLYPFPEEQLRAVLKKYTRAREWVWAQEEPQNGGAWSFVEPILRRFEEVGDLSYVGRDASASPATGSYKIHDREQRELVEAALTGEVPHLVRATPDTKFKMHPAESTAPAFSS